MPTHAVIWIDHKEARVFHVHPEATEATAVLAPQHHLHRHPKGRGEAREHPWLLSSSCPGARTTNAIAVPPWNR